MMHRQTIPGYFISGLFFLSLCSLQIGKAIADSEVSRSEVVNKTVSQSLNDESLHVLLSLPLHELSKVRTFPSIALTTTTLKESPGSVVVIDADKLNHQGFRDLNQAIEALVPGAHVVYDHFGMPILGLRGEMGNHRLLYVVNGLESCHRAQRGTFTERDIPLLGDIQQIGVLSGAGGAIRGSGAISGLIDVTTHTGLTFFGTDVKMRQGFGEYLSTFEFRHGRRFSENSGLFIYVGAAWQPGAARNEAPLFSDRSGMIFDGRDVIAGSPVPYRNPRLREGYGDQTKYKFHMQYDNDRWSTWIRYVRGGIKNPIDVAVPLRDEPFTPGQSADFRNGIQYFYQQASISLTRKIKFTETTALELNTSYDVLDFAHIAPVSNFTSRSSREDHLIARGLFRWEPEHLGIRTAWGYEYRRNRLGKRSIEKGDRDPQAVLQVQGVTDPWTIENHALLGEINWKPREDWAFFAGGRVDFHEHAEPFFSPRLAVTKQITNRGSLKVIYSRAIRYLQEDGIRNFLNANPGIHNIRPDTVTNFEITYQYQFTPTLYGSVTPWWNWHTQSGFTNVFRRYQRKGVEARIDYDTENFKGALSHHYGASNRQPVMQNGRFDQFFYSFPDHQSKLWVEHKLGRGFLMSSSLVANWRFDRIKDGLAKADIQIPKNAYKTSVLWNVGLSRRLSKNFTVRFDGLNLLALANKTLSRRNFLQQPGPYWAEPATLMLTVHKRFD